MRPLRRSAALVVLCLAPIAPAWAQGGSSASLAEMRSWSRDLAYSYLQGWSSGNAQALADVQGLYGPRVNFYGRFISQESLFGEKRRFGQRWPYRRYTHRPGTMRVTCEEGSRACLVRSVIDWVAANPARGSVSRGSSTFELGIGFAGPRPVVLFEKGRVIRTAQGER